MVEDEQGRILLQKRSVRLELFPSRWDHSAAGHVDAGEDYEIAAKRELKEELGIDDAELQEVATFRTSSEFEGRKLNRFNRLYRMDISAGTAIRFDPQEVSEVTWFPLEEIKKMIASRPDTATDGLKEVISAYY